MALSRPDRPPHRTVRIRTDKLGPADADQTDAGTTDYELSASVTLPAPVRLAAGKLGAAGKPDRLDAETRAVFQRRLLLCCLVAAAPFAFFLACAATNFIELFGRAVVGWAGLGLSAG